MAEMILVFFLMMAPTIMLCSKSEGLRMALIHRYSIHSPLHSPNLTAVEMIRQLVEISDRRHSLAIEDALPPNRSRSSSSSTSSSTSTSTNGVRPVVGHDNWIYMVRVGIGTPRPTYVNLHLDTGGNTVWTQCAPCRQCFPQDPPMYRPSLSRTFRALPCSHHLCAGLTCIGNMCFYKLMYGDETYTRGFLVADHFALASNVGSSSETVNGVVFGCSRTSSSDMYPDSRAVGGIIGMGSGPRSFIRQLGNRAKGRFSYCLVSLHHKGTSHLRFGRDIERIKNAQTTPLLPDPVTSHYHLVLKDLSVDGRLLHLPPNTFAPGPDWSGGCVVDSGSWLTYLTGTAFDSLVKSLEEHFKKYRSLVRVEGPEPLRLQLCYKKPRGFAAYPTIGFHFSGAVLRPKAANMFYIDEGSSEFCLFVKKRSQTLLGAVLQQNYRMVFDINKHKLTFAEENCARD